MAVPKRISDEVLDGCARIFVVMHTQKYVRAFIMLVTWELKVVTSVRSKSNVVLIEFQI